MAFYSSDEEMIENMDAREPFLLPVSDLNGDKLEIGAGIKREYSSFLERILLVDPMNCRQQKSRLIFR